MRVGLFTGMWLLVLAVVQMLPFALDAIQVCGYRGGGCGHPVTMGDAERDKGPGMTQRCVGGELWGGSSGLSSSMRRSGLHKSGGC